MKNVAILLAGGIGKRMDSGDIPKQFLEVDGKPILVYTIEVFQSHPEIDGIILVCVSTWIDYARKLVEDYGLTKVREIIPGGATGHESRLFGLRCARKYYDDAVVLLHDGVRPLIDAATVSKAIETTRAHGSAVVCSPVTETIYFEDEHVRAVIPRDQCSLMRSPQCFMLWHILKIHEQADAEGCHDSIDALTLMQQYEKSVSGVPRVLGPAENIKITTPLDFYMFEGIMKSRKKKQETEA